jgi:hypothetical protein
VGRQGNPLFCEAFVAFKDKDLYNRTKPTSDATLFKTYSDNPELGTLINALIFKSTVAPVTARADLSAIFIPDVIKIDLSTAAARLPGGGGSNTVLADDAGYSRLSIFGGDVLESPVTGHPFRLPGSAIGADATKSYVPGGWPNGRRIGEDVIDIGVTAVISDLRDPNGEIPVHLSYRVNQLPATFTSRILFFAGDIETLEPLHDLAPSYLSNRHTPKLVPSFALPDLL